VKKGLSMNNFKSKILSNGICFINRENLNTPRTTINLYVNGGNRSEVIPGLSDIVTRLLLKGTSNRSAEEIAMEADNNAIELDVDIKQDYSRVRATCLNQDLDKAIDLLSDVIQNPTFDLFDKEKMLLTGELQQELDSPRAKATDNLIRNMYPDHPYGIVASRMMETIDGIKKEDVLNLYHKTFKGPNISIVAVGDYCQNILVEKLENKFKAINTESVDEVVISPPELTKSKCLTLAKEDVSQAQVIRGWYGPYIMNSDFAALSILNNILGSAGLSSRLFIELRDKKGLAYAVRSSFEALKYSGNISVYIGTEPKNIKTAIQGFDEEIEKLINEPVKEEELESAKKNILGKRAIFHETNSQQCYYLGLYHILGAGAEYDEKVPVMLKNTSIEDIQHVARKYFSQPHITSILAPSEYVKPFEKENV
jgi:predicted Zn-dependent peptidase